MYQFNIILKNILVNLLFNLAYIDAGALETIGVKNLLYGIPGLDGGKPLAIKSYPAVENFQSPVYEVYGRPPYPYNLGSTAAIAVLSSTGNEANEVGGEVMFIQKQPPVGPIFVRGNITGLPPGKHGLHIHQAGDLRQGCDKLGGHFNPYLSQHGGPKDPVRHLGDLGNIQASEDGTAEILFIDPMMSLSAGPRGIVGRALVVTEAPDDLGQGENAESLIDGNSGKPLACGVIAYIR